MAFNSPAIVKAANDALVAAAAECNIAREFAANFSDEFVEPGLTVKVPVAAGGTADAFNASTNDYETDTGSVTWAPITLSSHVKSTFMLKALDLLEVPNAPYWGGLSRAGGQSVGRAISTAIGGLITSTSVTASATLDTVSLAAIAGLRESCRGKVADTVLALAGAEYTTLMAVLGSNYAGGADALAGRIPGLFGFKSVVCLRDVANGVKGALIPADALAIAGRAVPCDDPSVYSEFGTATDPDSGLTLTVRRHTSAANGRCFVNVEALFGAALVKAGDIVRLAASAQTPAN